jgi:ribosomal protein S18 acetylase RimI-like enzyme
MGYDVEKLSKRHDVSRFDCGEEDQNKYLREFAWQNMQLGYGVTYVATRESSNEVAGFYALAAGNVKFKNLPSRFKDVEGLPRYPAPTILLGQLGVNNPDQRQGLGKALLGHAVEKGVELSQDVGAVALEVHAASKKAREFYEEFGFVQMQDTPDHLFLSMEEGQTLVEESAPQDST